MLQKTKQITLTGVSIIDNQPVVNITATIPSDTAVATINQYVHNSELYDANKLEVRKDVREFTDLVYEIEDEMAAEADAATE